MPAANSTHLKSIFELKTREKVTTEMELPVTLDIPTCPSDNDVDGSANFDPPIYELTGVIAHDGEIDDGHNFVILRSSDDGLYYKIDDSNVSSFDFGESSNESRFVLSNSSILLYTKRIANIASVDIDPPTISQPPPPPPPASNTFAAKIMENIDKANLTSRRRLFLEKVRISANPLRPLPSSPPLTHYLPPP